MFLPAAFQELVSRIVMVTQYIHKWKKTLLLTEMYLMGALIDIQLY